MDFVAYIAAWAIIVLLLADRRRYLARVESKSRCNPRHAREGAEAMKEADIDDALKRLRKPVYDGGGEELDMDDAIGAIVHLRAELARVESDRDEARASRDRWVVSLGEMSARVKQIEADRDAAISRAESARREGLRDAANIASCYVINGGELHPDVPHAKIAKSVKDIAHVTGQYIAEAIRAGIDAPADGKREGRHENDESA